MSTKSQAQIQILPPLTHTARREPPPTASGHSFGRRLTRRAVYKRDETGPIARQVYDGEEDVYYDTFIDLHQLDMLACKAARNRGLKAKLGPLSVRIVALKKVEKAKGSF